MLENALNPIANGVFVYGRHHPEVGTQNLIVLVHPFFGKEEIKVQKQWQRDSRMWNPAALREIKAHKGYISNVKTLIAEASCPVVTFEEEENLERTVGKYRKFADVKGSEKEWYFIPTKAGDSTPATIDWNEAIQFIKRFTPEKLLVGGSNVESYPRLTNTHMGPLYRATQRFTAANIPYQVIPKTVFC